jgi:ankyrin repeat protein
MQTRALSQRRAAQQPNTELALLLERVAAELPPLVLIIVLRPLPAVELARLACVHKAYWLVLVQLRREHPGRRYAKPTEAIENLRYSPRLYRAAGYGDVAVLGSMIEAGVDEHGDSLQRNSRGAISRALHSAAGNGRLDAVELLVRAGANVHSHYAYALGSACHHGHCDVVAALIRHGAHVNRLSSVNSGHWSPSPLTYASIGGHLDVVHFLLAKNADVHADYDSALRASSSCGHTAVVRLLIQRGADVHARNNEAILKASENGHTDVVQLLLEHGAIMPAP